MMKRIPPFKLTAAPLNDEAARLAGFRSASPEIGTRHRLGGEPDPAARADWPLCPSGHGRMTFYAQLDSIGEEICLADCGMIHVFVCFDCFAVRAVLQSG